MFNEVKRFLINIAFVFFFVGQHLLLSYSATETLQNLEEHDFVLSFLNNYDLYPHARNTREYHSYLLGKTRESLSQLELHIKAHGFVNHGRIIVCGYQEDAIPSYIPSLQATKIDDEKSLKTDIGWEFASGNVYGFMTGFLLKDINHINKKKYVSIFEHILPEKVELFDDRAELFQRHAFGQAYSMIMRTRKQCIQSILKRDYKHTLSIIQNFWKYLYTNYIVDGSKRLIATQDILFSLQYIRYLMISELPLLNFFVGPDITYPIEVLPCQNEAVTVGAQAFIKRFERCLMPVHNQKTAYIFCSFVDGVGKSTLLGNLKNRKKYRDDIACYEHVDNSSSQCATFFSYDDNVLIVDLPAQMSHFIVKPEGYVYVDIDTQKEIENKKQEIICHLEHHKNQYIQRLINEINTSFEDDCICSEVLHDLRLAYINNVCLFDLSDVSWIPFSYEGDHFLFHTKNHRDIRVLVPIETVHSCGLKVIEPEHMIFSKGLTIPLPYNQFLEDLTKHMEIMGIKHVVFVDFISMYPRSSRENIRLNFLLQQLKFQCGDFFDIEKSLYKHFVNHQELYFLLRQHKKDVAQMLVLETTLRWALNRVVRNCQEQGLTNISGEQLYTFLHDTFTMLCSRYHTYINDLVLEKIDREYATIGRACEFDRDFSSLVCFSFELLEAFSMFMQKLFSESVKSAYFNSLWPGSDVRFDETSKQSGSVRFLDNGLPVEILYTFHRACRDKVLLHDFFNIVRAHWYALLSNILTWRYIDGAWMASENMVAMPPLFILHDEQYYYAVRPLIDRMHNTKLKNSVSFFNGADCYEKPCIVDMNVPCCLAQQCVDTHHEVYAFGYSAQFLVSNSKKNIIYAVEQCRKILEAAGYHDCFVPTSLLYEFLKRKKFLQKIVHSKHEKVTCSREAAQLFVRAIATLDMIVKDPMADIMIRRGSHKDFIAALHLLEQITLPCYWGITFTDPLFNDYDKIDPVIPWNTIGA